MRRSRPFKTNLFGALVWMGTLKDLLGERDGPCFYREALKNDTGRALQHDQYSLRINKAWVEERLKTPFKWSRRRARLIVVARKTE